MTFLRVSLSICAWSASSETCVGDDETTLLQTRVKSFSSAPQLCGGDSPCEPAAAAAAAAEAASMVASMATQASTAASIAAAAAVGVWPLTGQPCNTETTETAAAVCPGLWVQIGEVGANIDGCGLQSCDARYEAESEAACAASCDDTLNCEGFSFAPMNGDEDHKTTTVCTLYSSVEPTGTSGAVQVFCARPVPEPTLPPPEWFLPVDWTIEAKSIWDASYEADRVKVVDGNPWHNRDALPEHLILDAGEEVNLNAFATVAPGGWGGSAMKDYSLLVSDDGSEFTELQAGVGVNLGGNERQEVAFPATASRYWKLIMTSNYGYGHYITIQYLEWRSSR